MALCVGVISPKNTPLFVKCNNQADELQFQYILHTSLDFVDGKQLSVPKSSDSRELYLGLLNSTEQTKTFGFVTNTGVKILIVISAFDTSVRENDIRSMFRTLHLSYIGLVSNPFYIPGDPITCRKFSETVDIILRQN